jgi:hypothetical protein
MEQNEKEESKGRPETVTTTAGWQGIEWTYQSQESRDRPKDHGQLVCRARMQPEGVGAISYFFAGY